MRTHRALLLSYYTPPRPGVATTRTRQLLRYLPRAGWDVTAVTPRLDGADRSVVQTNYFDVVGSMKRLVGIGDRSTHEALGTAPAADGSRKTLRQRAISLGYAIVTYPDAQVGWFAHGRRAVRELLAREHYDAVISSAPPFTTNLILASLKLDIPWIADFRDLWADGDYSRSAFRNALDSVLERWTLGHASAVTTITPKMADVVRKHRPGTIVETIPNAFDPAEWERVPFERENRATFLYAGQLFGGKRDPRPLFRAVRALLDRGELAAEDLWLDFYSPREPWLDAAIAEAGLAGIVRVHGTVPRDDVLAAERRADRLIVLLWDAANAGGIATGKIFEYLGARREILAIGGPPQSAVDEILTRTNAGVRTRDYAVLEAEVLRTVREHRSAATRILDAESLRCYDAMTMAQRFADLLNVCTSARDRASTALS